MLFARVNRFLKTALEDSIHKTDIHRMAISNGGATEKHSSDSGDKDKHIQQ